MSYRNIVTLSQGHDMILEVVNPYPRGKPGIRNKAVWINLEFPPLPLWFLIFSVLKTVLALSVQIIVPIQT